MKFRLFGKPAKEGANQSPQKQSTKSNSTGGAAGAQQSTGLDLRLKTPVRRGISLWRKHPSANAGEPHAGPTVCLTPPHSPKPGDTGAFHSQEGDNRPPPSDSKQQQQPDRPGSMYSSFPGGPPGGAPHAQYANPSLPMGAIQPGTATGVPPNNAGYNQQQYYSPVSVQTPTYGQQQQQPQPQYAAPVQPQQYQQQQYYPQQQAPQRPPPQTPLAQQVPQWGSYNPAAPPPAGFQTNSGVSYSPQGQPPVHGHYVPPQLYTQPTPTTPVRQNPQQLPPPPPPPPPPPQHLQHPNATIPQTQQYYQPQNQATLPPQQDARLQQHWQSAPPQPYTQSSTPAPVPVPSTQAIGGVYGQAPAIASQTPVGNYPPAPQDLTPATTAASIHSQTSLYNQTQQSHSASPPPQKPGAQSLIGHQYSYTSTSTPPSSQSNYGASVQVPQGYQNVSSPSPAQSNHRTYSLQNQTAVPADPHQSSTVEQSPEYIPTPPPADPEPQSISTTMQNLARKSFMPFGLDWEHYDPVYDPADAPGKDTAPAVEASKAPVTQGAAIDESQVKIEPSGGVSHPDTKQSHEDLLSSIKVPKAQEHDSAHILPPPGSGSHSLVNVEYMISDTGPTHNIPDNQIYQTRSQEQPPAIIPPVKIQMIDQVVQTDSIEPIQPLPQLEEQPVSQVQAVDGDGAIDVGDLDVFYQNSLMRFISMINAEAAAPTDSERLAIFKSFMNSESFIRGQQYPLAIGDSMGRKGSAGEAGGNASSGNAGGVQSEGYGAAQEAGVELKEPAGVEGPVGQAVDPVEPSPPTHSQKSSTVYMEPVVSSGHVGASIPAQEQQVAQEGLVIYQEPIQVPYQSPTGSSPQTQSQEPVFVQSEPVVHSELVQTAPVDSLPAKTTAPVQPISVQPEPIYAPPDNAPTPSQTETSHRNQVLRKPLPDDVSAYQAGESRSPSLAKPFAVPQGTPPPSTYDATTHSKHGSRLSTPGGYKSQSHSASPVMQSRHNVTVHPDDVAVPEFHHLDSANPVASIQPSSLPLSQERHSPTERTADTIELGSNQKTQPPYKVTPPQTSSSKQGDYIPYNPSQPQSPRSSRRNSMDSVRHEVRSHRQPGNPGGYAPFRPGVDPRPGNIRKAGTSIDDLAPVSWQPVVKDETFLPVQELVSEGLFEPVLEEEAEREEDVDPEILEVVHELARILPSIDSRRQKAPILEEMSNKLAVLDDDFSFIEKSIAEFDRQDALNLKKVDELRKVRHDENQEYIDSLFTENEIAYSDISKLDEKFNAKEEKLRAEEEQETWQRFVDQVFQPVYDTLQEGIKEVMDLHFKVSGELLRVAVTGEDRWAGSGHADLEDVLEMLLRIDEVAEKKHAKVQEAIRTRDRRFRKTVLEPLSFVGNIAKMKSMEKYFIDSERKGIIDARKKKLRRSQVLHSTLFRLIEAGISKDQDYILRLTSTLNKVLSLPSPPVDLLSQAHTTLSTCLQGCKCLLKASYRLEQALNVAHHDVAVAESALSPQELESIRNRAQERTKMDTAERTRALDEEYGIVLGNVDLVLRGLRCAPAQPQQTPPPRRQQQQEDHTHPPPSVASPSSTSSRGRPVSVPPMGFARDSSPGISAPARKSPGGGPRPDRGAHHRLSMIHTSTMPTQHSTASTEGLKSPISALERAKLRNSSSGNIIPYS